MMQSRSDAAPLIVAGMHRSGTSFVAALLRQSGVDMGTRLMPAGKGNKRGHFENLDFVEFHERWLRLSGYEEAGWAVEHALKLPEEAAAEATDLLTSNERPGAWGWKDPRTALFLDFWGSVAPNAFYIFLYREPSEVVDSLFRRGDGAVTGSPELAARAWLSHNGTLLRFARANRARCLLANVAVIAREPQRFLRAVASRFDTPLDSSVTSPFEADLMTTMDVSGARPTLLRYLVPEVDRTFVDLEAEADLAAGVHRDGAITPKRAREVFFQLWAASRISEPAPPSSTLPGTDEILDKAQEQVIWAGEISKSMSKIREELEQYKSALSEFSTTISAHEGPGLAQ